MKSNRNSTLVKSVEGHDLRLTPRNEIFIQTPDGSAVFVAGHDSRGLAVVSDNHIPIPAQVLREAAHLFIKAEAAADASYQDSLAEPPADLIEDEDYIPTGDELIHGVEELRYA